MNFIGKETLSKRKFKKLNARQLKKQGENYLKFYALIQLKKQLDQNYFNEVVEYFLSQVDEKGNFLLDFEYYRNKLKQENLLNLSDLYKKQLEEANLKQNDVENLNFLVYEWVYDMILNCIDYQHLKNKKLNFVLAYVYNGDEAQQDYIDNNVAYQLGNFDVSYCQEKDFHETIKKDFMNMLKNIKTTIKELFDIEFYVENDIFINKDM